MTISVVGCKKEFTIYEDEKVDTYLQLIAGEERRGGAGAADEPEDAAAAPAADDAAGGEGAGEGEDQMDTNWGQITQVTIQQASILWICFSI